MARIRTIKPDFWKHEELSELPESVHMLAAALLNYADDEGYFNANDKLVKAECCPLREPSVSIHDALTMLSNVGYLRLGKSTDGKRFGHIINFDLHQRVNRKTPSKIKNIAIAWDDSVSAHAQLTESSPLEGKGKEGKGTKTADAVTAGKDYAFNGDIIHLVQSDVDKWSKAYPNINLIGELTARDTWLASPRAKDSDRENWFIATSNYLKNADAKALAAKSARDSPPPMTTFGEPYKVRGIL